MAAYSLSVKLSVDIIYFGHILFEIVSCEDEHTDAHTDTRTVFINTVRNLYFEYQVSDLNCYYTLLLASAFMLDTMYVLDWKVWLP